MTHPLDRPLSVMAGSVRSGEISAVALATEVLERLARGNRTIKAATRILARQALGTAAVIDKGIAQGADPGPLAGVPFGVKDLFDVAGLTTTAGAAMRRDIPAAISNAEAVARLQAAGAVLCATLNMDEYAYGFATVNAHWGTTRNPHDPARLAGGSSGGSAAAVAANMLPLTLGSDTNGSIRVPASLCGVWGLKPSHGALPMEGVFPFVDSFDDIGPFARSADDLAVVTTILAGETLAPAEETPRIALLGGWFADNVTPPLACAIDRLSESLGGLSTVMLPEVDKARSAAFLMTAAEGGQRHLPALRSDAMGFDPATRDRLIAGAALPVAAYLDALNFRARFRAAADALFAQHDILIAPATPGVAPLVDDPMIIVGGARVPARANLGLYTQPLSFIGLPVIAAPVGHDSGLPLGIQIIAAPGKDATLFAFARKLEQQGLLGASTLASPSDNEGTRS